MTWFYITFRSCNVIAHTAIYANCPAAARAVVILANPGATILSTEDEDGH